MPELRWVDAADVDTYHWVGSMDSHVDDRPESDEIDDLRTSR